MSERNNRFYTMSGPDQYDPHYAIYDSSFPPAFARAAGPATHFDGMSFWYRPEPQETAFEHNKMLYNQNMPIPHSPLDQSMSIKHRRTRSGCFTCRHRRVKCDETRPICERCKKGNRECQFPQPSSSSRRSEATDTRSASGKTSPYDPRNKPLPSLPTVNDEEDEDEEDEDEAEDEREESVSPELGPRRAERNTPPLQTPTQSDGRRRYLKSEVAVGGRDRDSPSSTGTKSPVSRTETPVSVSSTPVIAHRSSVKSSRWCHLDPAMQQYLQFHHDKITRYHYLLKLDPTDFIHNELIDIALSFEPLLHAVVGFSAYHHTLGKTNGRFQEFWKYYCESIMLLRKWLETNTDRNEAVLLTILQLATFEEYLGDWAGVASHLKAAYSIFNTLYTHENIMDTSTSRCILDWLSRGDVAVSLMAGVPTIMKRQWFSTALDWHQKQVEADTLSSVTAVPCLVAKLRLIGFDIATVHAHASSMPNVMKHFRSISERMDGLRVDIQTLRRTTQPAHMATRRGSRNEAPGAMDDLQSLLFQGNLWPLNLIWIDWYATEQMHKYKTVLFTRAMQAMEAKPPSGRSTTQKPTINLNPSLDDLPPELEKFSLIQCQIFEAIEKNPVAPSGAILGCQASLALASVFLNKAPKYMIWARRKLAKMERMGYVWPPSFRKRMSQLWGDERVLEWWLPDDELKIKLLDEIRDVAEDRNKEIDARGGDERDDIIEMKAVLDKLDFGRSGARARRDSVWSMAGTDGQVSANIHTPDDSEDSDNSNGDDYSNDGERGTELDKQHNRSESRDSGFGATYVGNMRPPPPPPPSLPTLEYSNRMSGIWEG